MWNHIRVEPLSKKEVIVEQTIVEKVYLGLQAS